MSRLTNHDHSSTSHLPPPMLTIYLDSISAPTPCLHCCLLSPHLPPNLAKTSRCIDIMNLCNLHICSFPLQIHNSYMFACCQPEIFANNILNIPSQVLFSPGKMLTEAFFEVGVCDVGWTDIFSILLHL